MKLSCLTKSALLAALCASVALPQSAAADNLFLVQLGLFGSQERAKKQFDEVEAAHSELLAGKRYILKQSQPISGGDVSWRVLVGPFDSRKSASRNCAELKDKGTDCFVVETAAVNADEFDGARQVASATSSADGVPITSDAQSGTSRSDSELLPWNWFDRKSSPSTPMAEADKEPEKVSTAEPESSSNININTHSIYVEKQVPVVESSNLADAIADLFDLGADEPEKATLEVATIKPEEEVVQAVPTTPVVETPADIPAPVEMPEAPEPQATVSVAPEEITPKPQATPIDRSTRSGEVEVAEAIPVPLTEPENVPITISEPPPGAPKLLDIKIPKKPAEQTVLAEPVKAEEKSPEPIVQKVEPKVSTAPPAPEPIMAAPKPMVEPTPRAAPTTAQQVAPTTAANTTQEAPRPAAAPARSYQQGYESSRLLQISVFQNDRDAFACLTNVQAGVPAAATLRTRIIKSTIGQAVLRFGPVNDSYVEADICAAVTSSCNSDLRCRIMTEQRPRTAHKPLSASERNAPKPQDISPRKLAPSDQVNTAPQQAEQASTQESLAARPMWIQLGTSSSESDAADRFASLQAQHPDLLKSYSANITGSDNRSLAGEVHRLRIGPFATRNDAQGLCAKLSSRGVGCLILSK